MGGSGAGMVRLARGVDVAGWKTELAKLNVKALLPVDGSWFSAPWALLVGTEGVVPFGGVVVVGKMSDSPVVGGPFDNGSGGSSGPLNTVKLGPRWTGGIAGISTSTS